MSAVTVFFGERHPPYLRTCHAAERIAAAVPGGVNFLEIELAHPCHIRIHRFLLGGIKPLNAIAVSYTHLDVYKRQIDSNPENEKSDCWLAYSIITDLYQPNPSRMKDWLSIPKSNGYESLHITVYGPGERWVEVQIRTKRMDLIAEKGLAAHWKYKGVKSESNLDAWMNNVRDILETAETGPMELMKNMKMDIYDKEVFVFTPKGDLYKLPFGASSVSYTHLDVYKRQL